MINASLVVIAAAALFCALAVGDHEWICGENETRLACGRLCEERCNAAAPGFCRGIRCERSGCRCKPNFARDPSTNRCIPKATCPLNKCAYGEVKALCGQRCEATCDRPWVPDVCRIIRCSDWGCRCDSAGGFVRNRHGICVHVRQC